MRGRLGHWRVGDLGSWTLPVVSVTICEVGGGPGLGGAALRGGVATGRKSANEKRVYH